MFKTTITQNKVSKKKEKKDAIDAPDQPAGGNDADDHRVQRSKATQHCCANMTDTLFKNGSTVPAQKLQYELCMDLEAAKWLRVDSQQSSLFNGSHVFTFNATDCMVKKDPSPNPRNEMPFTMVDIDAGAERNGSEVIDGQKTTIFHHYRPRGRCPHLCSHRST